MKTIVLVTGGFDPLHPGHIEYFKAAKQLGDELHVGLNSDESVKRLKGTERPINHQDDRKYVLESLYCVDQVIIFNEDTPYNLIKRIEPTYITKGGDYKVEDVVGNDLAEVVIIPTLQGFSTTDTLRRLNNDTVKWLC